MPDKKFLCEYTNRYLDKELEISMNMTKSGYKSYVLTLTMFLGYASEKLRCTSDQIKASDFNYKIVYDFMTDSYEKRSWSPATWNARLAGIKSFIRFLSMEDPWYLESYNRVKLISGRRLPRRDPFYINNAKLVSIVESFRSNSWSQFRDCAMVQFMVATGLRASEVCNLKVKDILWLSSSKVHVRFIGKGRKKRILPLVDSSVIQCLCDLLAKSDVNSEFVFPGKTGTRMSTSNLRDRINRFFCPHGLKHKVTLHTLRRSAAMNWLTIGMDIYHVSAMLGHEHISTTEQYLRSNLEDRESELKRIGIDDTEFQAFKPSEEVVLQRKL